MGAPTFPKLQPLMSLDAVLSPKAEGAVRGLQGLRARMPQGGTPSFSPTIFDELIDANIVIAPPWGMPEDLPLGSDTSGDDDSGPAIPSPSTAPGIPAVPAVAPGTPSNLPLASVPPSGDPVIPNLTPPVLGTPVANALSPPMDLSTWARQLELLAMMMREL